MADNNVIHINDKKYEPKIQERFSHDSFTGAYRGTGFKWDGAKTIVTKSVDNMKMNDYKRTGDNRFGTVEDIGDEEQEMTCTKVRSFTGTIDAVDNSDQAITKSAATCLSRQLREVVNPEVDIYRFKKWCEGANVQIESASKPTKSTIEKLILDLGTAMSNRLVPEGGRTLFIVNSLFTALQTADMWVNVPVLAEKALRDGEVGRFNRMKVVAVPDGFFPNGVWFIIKHKSATVDPIKLQMCRVLKAVQGYSGPVIEGVTYYDSFVLATKGDGVGICANSEMLLKAPEISGGPSATITCSGAKKILYTTDGSNPRYSDSAEVYSSAVKLTNGQTLKAVGIAENRNGPVASFTYTA